MDEDVDPVEGSPDIRAREDPTPDYRAERHPRTLRGVSAVYSTPSPIPSWHEKEVVNTPEPYASRRKKWDDEAPIDEDADIYDPNALR
jgi:hypothetical protein